MDLSKMKTWDGTAWRDYQAGDENLSGVMVVAGFAGNGALDPSIPVVTGADSVAVVDEMHARYKKS